MLKKCIFSSLMAASFIAQTSQENQVAKVNQDTKAPQTVDLDARIAPMIDYVSTWEGFGPNMKELLCDLGKFFLNHEEPYKELQVKRIPGVNIIRIIKNKQRVDHYFFNNILSTCSDSMFGFNQRKIVSVFLLNFGLPNDNIPKIIHGTKTDCSLISRYGKLTIQIDSDEKTTQTTAPIMPEISTPTATMAHKKQ